MMIIDIKLCRFDNVPWGFRLIGGSDFEHPITVVKVNEGSLAEEAGLRVDDVIVRINDEATSPLTHEEMDKLIRSCGNTLFLGIRRESKESDSQHTTLIEEEQHIPNEDDVVPIWESYTTVETKEADICERNVMELQEERTEMEVTATEEVHEEIYEEEMHERSISVLSEESERKLVEHEIAAVLSNEMETVQFTDDELGVSPKRGICMTSDVLCAVKEEAAKSKSEKEQENRKWTTFLQKPNRPIPKSKQQIEAERRAANAYKVTIVKSARRSVTPQPPVPAKEDRDKEIVEDKVNKENGEVERPVEPEQRIPTPLDSEIPNLQDEPNDPNEGDEEEKSAKKNDEEINGEKDTEEVEDVENVEDVEVEEKDEATEVETTETTMMLNEKTDEELALEQQLADVQKQLAALSNLPSTIQVTLDAVTKQLSELVPMFRLQQQTEQLHKQSAQVEMYSSNLEDIDEHATKEYNEGYGDGEKDNSCNKLAKEDEMADNFRKMDDDEDSRYLLDNQMTKEIASVANEAHNTIDKDSINQQQQQQHQQQRVNTMRSILHHHEVINEKNGDDGGDGVSGGDVERGTKKQTRHDVIEELEEHLERKNRPKRTKRAFGPLTPSSDRPLVLPGGRRWYRPKDAYNDEFIAETLTAQAELIAGTALGVNFMKYQKPERKIDLNRSEVYKVIHHLDRQPVRGIEVRPPVVPAEADIRKAVHS